jgi:hypothetical protein
MTHGYHVKVVRDKRGSRPGVSRRLGRFWSYTFTPLAVQTFDGKFRVQQIQIIVVRRVKEESEQEKSCGVTKRRCQRLISNALSLRGLLERNSAEAARILAESIRWKRRLKDSVEGRKLVEWDSCKTSDHRGKLRPR